MIISAGWTSIIYWAVYLGVFNLIIEAKPEYAHWSGVSIFALIAAIIITGAAIRSTGTTVENKYMLILWTITWFAYAIIYMARPEGTWVNIGGAILAFIIAIIATAGVSYLAGEDNQIRQA